VAEVSIGSAGLVLDHALERFKGERIAEVMERHRHAPTIGVTVSLVAACLGTKIQAVANKGLIHFVMHAGDSQGELFQNSIDMISRELENLSGIRTNSIIQS
jgi:hypothetical protein